MDLGRSSQPGTRTNDESWCGTNPPPGAEISDTYYYASLTRKPAALFVRPCCCCCFSLYPFVFVLVKKF